jgi:hypothetical protein
LTTDVTAYRLAGLARAARAQIAVTGLAVQDRNGARKLALRSSTPSAGCGWDTDQGAIARNWRGGAWGPGPFDNDTAADWATDVEDADVAARIALIRDALALAVEAQCCLHAPDAMAAVAAAAVVSGQRSNGWDDGCDYGPSPAALEGLVFEESVRTLAVRAVARVLGPNSEWQELWENAQQLEEARTELHLVIRVLEDTPPAGS